MRKILVAIDGRRGAWTALSRACALAKRMDVDLNVLLVASPAASALPQKERELEEAVKNRLSLLIETAQTEGVRVHFFMTEGHYENEIVNFVNNHKIELLVIETVTGDVHSTNKDSASLRTLRHRLTCTMEMVTPIKHVPEQVERIT